MESKVKCLYLLVLGRHLNINNFYRKWKSEFSGFGIGDYYIRSLQDTIKEMNKAKIFNKPTSIRDVGEFVENNIGFGR